VKDSLRLFIAIDFPPSVKRQIGHLIGKLAKNYPQVRWEREKNLHLTLKFLGWSRSKIEEIIQGMERSVDGVKPFWLEPERLGFFLRQNMIIWLGLKSQEGLFKIVENLENEMAKLGFPRGNRPFSAHITLGRRKKTRPGIDCQKIAKEIADFKTSGIESVKAGEIVLMKSQLTPKGSIYSEIRKVSFL